MQGVWNEEYVKVVEFSITFFLSFYFLCTIHLKKLLCLTMFMKFIADI